MYEAFVGEEERKEGRVWVGRELLFELKSKMRELGFSRFFPGESLPAHIGACPCQQTFGPDQMMETRS
jgi:hypothetical protein